MVDIKTKINGVIKNYSDLFMEPKKQLVCETCGEEFDRYDYIGPGKHAVKTQHYSFKFKGTNLKLAVL
jgi:hypothetical protein